ncbi:MAG: phosphate acyltransferase PlsX [Endomicrobium sp.]|jgi:glycerol-3-phosphate acyltransferase PlsX|nr:phosphate acyltransferase PlsX [Endomicrobium sp.]
MIIALDAMGGDFAPASTVEGAVLAAKAAQHKIILVGDNDLILKELSKQNNKNSLPLSINIEIVHAPEIISMTEQHPVKAVRSKKNSSLAVCAQLVSEGKADAFVSMGNSGAVMASAFFYLRRIRGIIRPAITTMFPTIKGNCIVADMGANVDCKPEHLFQFGIMASVFCSKVIGIKRPKIALLSIGEEPNKGNELTLATFNLFKKSIGIDLDFIGNIEGKDIPTGKADVVICDGFIGNVILKFGEGLAGTILYLIKQKLGYSPVKWILFPFVRLVKKTLETKFDYSKIGGAPLLGVNGVCIIGHGRSNSHAVKNAILTGAKTAQYDVIHDIEIAVNKFNYK